MQKAQRIDPALYVTRLRKASSTVRSLTYSPSKTETPSPRQCERWTHFGAASGRSYCVYRVPKPHWNEDLRRYRTTVTFVNVSARRHC